MTMPVVETKDMRSFPPTSGEIAPQRLLATDNLAALLVNVDAGQTIEPCRMSATVLYYVIEGNGNLHVEEKKTELQTGLLVLVPPGTVRTISAVEPMRVLTVQVP